MTTHLSPFKIALALATFFIFTIELHAQDVGSILRNSQNSEADRAVIALSSWIDLDAPPGRERSATDTIMKDMPGWKRDQLGNLMLHKGSGSPRRVVACALDRPAFAVTEITANTGLSVTAYKRATRLGSTRFTARALDDRAGSTALLLATRRIQPGNLKRKVIFAWSVREETGLEGAMALAKQYAASVKRVYSVDTLVSSDSPIETTRFANAPLGRGAVIRGLDNSAIAPLSEMDRILDLARVQGIPIQVAATNGGTDGSDFVRYGALHVSLSWPGRYSHSPVEVLDLRDLQALERLIYAIATAP